MGGECIQLLQKQREFVEEAEHRFGLLALAQVGIGVAERAGIGILGEEDEDARLAPAALRHIVAHDARAPPCRPRGTEKAYD